MRKLLTIFFAAVCSVSAWATCGSGYAHSIPVKLVKASGSNQTNYPVKVWGRDWRVATTGNGGYLQNTATNSIGRTGLPADIQFCPDQTGSGTPLKYEAVYYNSTYGDYEFWVQQPTYHTASFDTIYLYIGNAAVNTSQQDLTLWSDVSYVGVWHYPNGTTLDLINSVTGTAATNNGGTAYAGAYGGSLNLSGSGQFVYATKTAAFEPTTAITLESVALPTTTPGDNELFSKPYRTSGWSSPFLSYRQLGDTSGGGPGRNCMDVTTSGARTESCNSAQVYLVARWSYMAGTYDGANITVYSEGSQTSQIAKTGNIDYNGGSGGDLTLGAATRYASITFWPGALDEQRINSTALSANWIATGQLQLSPYKSSYLFDESSYSKPAIRQFTTCTGTAGTASCVLPFDVTAGGTMVVLTACLDASCSNPCPSMSNDSLGLSYTLRGSSDYTGAIQHYYVCAYTAPITTAGADTITIPTASQTSTIVYETKATTTTSAVYVSASANTNTPTMTGTSPANDSLLLAGTFGGQNGGPATGTTQGTYFVQSGPQGTASTDHFSVISAAYGIVSSGSKSIQFNAGNSGVMMILPSAPVAASQVRHRVANF